MITKDPFLLNMPGSTSTAIDRAMTMPRSFKATMSRDGKEVWSSDVTADAATKISDILNKEPPKMQQKILRKIRAQMDSGEFFSNLSDLDKEMAEVSMDIQSAQRGLDVLRQLKAWTPSSGGAKLERAVGSRSHSLSQAFVDGKVLLFDINDANVVRAAPAKMKERDFGHIFVVEHDWAAAFKDATGIDDGWKLPYDRCSFEFQFSGIRAIAVCEQSDLVVVSAVFIELSRGWVHTDNRTTFGPLFEMIDAQIAAVCLSLEAAVAEAEVVRVNHRLNHARERRGKLPIADHHIVSLARRHRYARLPSTGENPSAKRRLHFRRGHDRHYAAYKVWIKWQLVGDPDLGFIDKEYRL